MFERGTIAELVVNLLAPALQELEYQAAVTVGLDAGNPYPRWDLLNNNIDTGDRIGRNGRHRLGRQRNKACQRDCKPSGSALGDFDHGVSQFCLKPALLSQAKSNMSYKLARPGEEHTEVGGLKDARLVRGIPQWPRARMLNRQ